MSKVNEFKVEELKPFLLKLIALAAATGYIPYVNQYLLANWILAAVALGYDYYSRKL